MRSNFAIYRGKRRDTDEWVTGYFRYYNSCSFIDTIPVYPDTVGRLLEFAVYDSFEDNPKIFQGDIIGIWDRHEDIYSVPYSRSGVVLDENSIIEGALGRRFPQDTTRVKVIGNIYDNPELINFITLGHYITRINDVPKNYRERHAGLISKYHIHGMQAACYLCNYPHSTGSGYLCSKMGGKACEYLSKCTNIFIKEEDKFRE